MCEDLTDLAHLIRFGLTAFPLKIDAFQDAGPGKDMMTAGNSHPKALALQQMAEIRETNVRIRFAAQELFKGLLDAHPFSTLVAVARTGKLQMVPPTRLNFRAWAPSKIQSMQRADE